MLAKNIIAISLACFSYAATTQANSLYILGQAGVQNSDDSNERPITGRLAIGYGWNAASNFGNNTNNPKLVCFNYGLELGYQNSEKRRLSYNSEYGFFSTTRNYSDHVHMLDLLGVLDVYPTQNFDIFIKLGPAVAVHTANAEENTHTRFGNYSSSYSEKWETNIIGKYMVGLGYNITSKVNVNLAYAKTFWISNFDSESSALAGIKYSFK